MTIVDLKSAWKKLYEGTPARLDRMAGVGRVVTAFNANIDAVLKVRGERLTALAAEVGLGADAPEAEGERRIRTPKDVVRGLVRCFARGIAEEWLVDDELTYAWMRAALGYDRLQMGGQGGIVANAMAVCGVQQVLAHCASLPSDQASLFLDLPNLVSTDEHGGLRRARTIDRPDPPMIHWILEFDHGDSMVLGDRTVTCPKSNRFIATYDPLNFRLHVDAGFAAAAAALRNDVVILSGYHMLSEHMPDGTLAAERIATSFEVVKAWKARNPDCLVHLEVASTQDLAVRRAVVDRIARSCDSIGVNERELIDLLVAIGRVDLAERCEHKTDSANLLDGLEVVFHEIGCPRVQLHMFGLYVTMQRPGFRVTPLANRRGMQLAAVVAAGKAGTGAIERREALLWAADREIGDVSAAELQLLADHVASKYGPNDLAATGLLGGPDYDLIAVPTVIIPNPVTLVGMGDTISSVSLVGSL